MEGPDFVRLLLRLICGCFLLVLVRPVSAASSWIVVHSPNFELHTTGTASAVGPILERLELARAFFLQCEWTRSLDRKPLKIIVFTDAASYVPFRPTTGVAAFFQPGPEADSIVLGGTGPEYERIAIHEYAHFVFHRTLPGLPLWLHEGLADLYSSVELRSSPTGNYFRIGEPVTGRRFSASDAAILDFKALFDAVPDSAVYTDTPAGWRFYSESWALAHLLVTDPEYAARLPEFLTALSSGTETSAVFDRVYRRSIRQVAADLEAHWAQQSPLTVTVAAPEFVCPRDRLLPVITTPSSLETDLLLARVLAANPRTQSAAEQQLNALVTEAPQDPGPRETLAYLLLRQNRTDEARTNLAAAVQFGSQNADLIARYAMLSETRGAPPEEVLALLERALQLETGNDEIRLAVGCRIARGGAFERAIATLTELKNRTTRNSYITSYTLSYCYLRLGNWNEGRTYALKALGTAQTAEERTTSNSLLQYERSKSGTE